MGCSSIIHKLLFNKFFLIDLEFQRWITRGKFKYSLND
nr:MAG TPA: hypothetical protein [Caudoviricetes sp.]